MHFRRVDDINNLIAICYRHKAENDIHFVITEYLAIIISRKVPTNSSLLRYNATQDFDNRSSMSRVNRQVLQKEKEEMHNKAIGHTSELSHILPIREQWRDASRLT